MKNTKAQESGTRSNNANSSNTEYPTESKYIKDIYKNYIIQ